MGNVCGVEVKKEKIFGWDMIHSLPEQTPMWPYRLLFTAFFILAMALLLEVICVVLLFGLGQVNGSLVFMLGICIGIIMLLMGVWWATNSYRQRIPVFSDAFFVCFIITVLSLWLVYTGVWMASTNVAHLRIEFTDEVYDASPSDVLRYEDAGVFHWTKGYILTQFTGEKYDLYTLTYYCAWPLTELNWTTTVSSEVGEIIPAVVVCSSTYSCTSGYSGCSEIHVSRSMQSVPRAGVYYDIFPQDNPRRKYILAKDRLMNGYPGLTFSDDYRMFEVYTEDDLEEKRDEVETMFVGLAVAGHLALFIGVVFITAAYLRYNYYECDWSCSKLSFEVRSTGTYAKTIPLQALGKRRKVDCIWSIYNNRDGPPSFLHALPPEVMMLVSNFSLGMDTSAYQGEQGNSNWGRHSRSSSASSYSSED
ncbi:hypothetical protein QOT17_011517 [Balamuthia mandrillaris]